MPSLGFSVEGKTTARRRCASDIRRDAAKDQDAGFIASMVALGLLLLALGFYHDQARALLGRFAGF